jgi:hypothetical protein
MTNENEGGHFLIFVPGRGTGCKADLEKIGIGDLVDGTQSSTAIDVGPDGGPGVVWGWELQSDTIVPQYKPEQQTWHQSEEIGEWKEGRYWFGFYKDRPVTPEKLLRKKIFQSMEIELGDGNHWQVPIAAYLPHNWGLKGRKIAEPFSEYSEKAEKYFVIFCEHKPEEIVKVDDGFGFCCEGLGLNYRITPDIVDALNLIDDTIFGVFAAASCEYDVIQLIQDQKKTLDSQPTPVGSDS